MPELTADVGDMGVGADEGPEEQLSRVITHDQPEQPRTLFVGQSSVSVIEFDEMGVEAHVAPF